MTTPTPQPDPATGATPPANTTPQQLPAAPAASPPVVPPAATTATPPTDDKPLGPAGESALKAEREARKAAEKSAADALAKVKAFEDREKSAEQLAAERASAAEQTAGTATVQLARYEACAENGLPLTVAKFLGGSTKEEIAAAAVEFKTLFGTGSGARPAGGLPNVPPGAGDGGAPSSASVQAGRDRYANRKKPATAFTNT